MKLRKRSTHLQGIINSFDSCEYDDMDLPEDGKHAVCFRLGDRGYGIDIYKIIEMSRWTGAERLPYQKPYVIGVISTRGSIVPIFDVAHILNGNPSEPTGYHIIAVVEYDKKMLGLLFDSASEILEYREEEIQDPKEICSVAFDDVSKYISGMFLRNNHLIALLNLDALFDLEFSTAENTAREEISASVTVMSEDDNSEDDEQNASI